jgi:tRNA U34 2-thiouridine synthase MnmA/TrmU
LDHPQRLCSLISGQELPSPIKALALLSGGLDSTLALRLIHDQGVEVTALNFHTGFCFTDARRAARKEAASSGGPSDALSAAASLGIPIEVIDISKGYLEVLHHPDYGYGKNVNPCIDCRIHMFKMAREVMHQYGAQFVFTGEVLGQRPKSQYLAALNLIARESGLEDLLVRPLSALILPPTLPEREGWIDRSKLMGFHGRTRKPQMALAAELGIGSYPQPAGGCCFLTDPQYGRKVRDLWQHLSKDELEWDDYLLLKVGRHIRLSESAKVILGRDEGDNLFLDQVRKDQIRLEVRDFMGPVGLLEGTIDESDKVKAARIIARYSDGKESVNPIAVNFDVEGTTTVIEALPYHAEEVHPWVIS